MMSNYADDIRSYDDDPRSPFYKGPQGLDKEERCEGCKNYVDECDCESAASPSQQAKASGLTSLKQVTDLTGVSKETLRNWDKNKPKLFSIVLEGCNTRLANKPKE